MTPRGASVRYEQALISGEAAGSKNAKKLGLLAHFLRGANHLQIEFEPTKSQMRTHDNAPSEVQSTSIFSPKIGHNELAMSGH